MILGQCPDVLPTSDFSINFCNFPFAWEVTKGENINYSGWTEHVNLASKHGAIIMGSHGDMYQLGDLSFWESVPVDVFAVMGRKINGFQAMKPDYKIKVSLEESAYLVAGAVALLKSIYPDYSNNKI